MRYYLPDSSAILASVQEDKMAILNQGNALVGVRLSQHAARRQRQRGIAKDQLGAFYYACDQEHPVGRGCIAMTLSKRGRAELLADGWSPSEVDAMKHVAAVEGPGGLIVTVCKQYGKRSRIYRRGNR